MDFEKSLKISAVSGIMITFISILSVLATFFINQIEHKILLNNIFSLSFLIFNIIFHYGFIKIGKEIKNNVLVLMSFSLIIINLISYLLGLFSFYYSFLGLIILSISNVILYVYYLAEIGFSIGILKLRENFGNIVIIVFVLGIIDGLINIKQLSPILRLFVFIPLNILKVIILSKFSKIK